MNNLRDITEVESVFSLGRIILVVVLVFGIYVRVGEYIANRSVWLDEASLALNVIDKSFNELLTQPLDYNQAAPIGFLLLAKAMVSIFGKSEFVFRFIPLISGFISFFVLYRLSILCCLKRIAVLPLFLVATSVEMVRYATEFKQYSSDVLLALVIPLYVISFLDKRYTLKRGIMFGAIGSVILWFSFPAVFILGGVGAVLFFSFISKRRWEETRNLIVSFLFWGISFASNYFLFLKEIGSNAALDNYWLHSFMPLPPFTISEQLWVVETFVKILYHPGMINQAIVGLVLFIIGAYAICKNQRIIFFVLFSPLLLILAASSIHKYPFEGRAILFYVPFLYLFIASGVSFLIDKKSYFSKILGTVFLISILYPALSAAYGQLSQGLVYREEIKPILKYVRTHMQKEDTLYMYYGADKAFQYYLDSYEFGDEFYIKGIGSRGDWEKYKEDLDQLKGKKRVWVIFTHVHFARGDSEERYMVNHLESIGKRLDSVQAIQASAYLYDLTNSGKRNLKNET